MESDPVTELRELIDQVLTNPRESEPARRLALCPLVLLEAAALVDRQGR